MRPGVLLFWGLVVAVLFNLVMQVKKLRRDTRMETVLREVHAVLLVWADTWPDPVVRQQLLKVLTR